jgi:hypothetical protein
MQPTAILYPVFVLIALTFFLQIRMAIERAGALRRGEAKVAEVSLDHSAWPPHALQAANAFHNQLELPILFYLVVAFALIIGLVDVVFHVLAWVFALLRLWHAYIHSTHNRVGPRSRVYAAGSITLMAMWIYLAVRFIAASA